MMLEPKAAIAHSQASSGEKCCLMAAKGRWPVDSVWWAKAKSMMQPTSMETGCTQRNS